MKPVVAWNTAPPGFEHNYYGYSLMIERLAEALPRFATVRDDAPLALTIVAPYAYFFPSPRARNVLFTMVESRDVPRIAAEGIRRADAIIVPSTFCAEAIRPHVGPGTMVHVVPLGVEQVPYTQRDPKTTAFRWLWNGALNIRKGWTIVRDTWARYFVKRPDMELYIKTTLREGHKYAGTIRRKNNVWFDYRNLSWPAMEQLYASAHGFVLPTLGEGWGQTLAEAMSSGMPCVATRATGYLDFANDRNAYLVDCSTVRLPTDRQQLKGTVDGKTEWHMVKPRPFAEAIEEVQVQYHNALVRGREAARTVRKLTWEASARKLAAVLAQEMAQAGRRRAAA